MLCSYSYYFSQSSSPTVEIQSASSRSRDTTSSCSEAAVVRVASSSTSDRATDIGSSIGQTISDWSSSLASTIGSAVPSSVTTLFNNRSQDKGETSASYLQSVYSGLPTSAVTSWFASSTSDSIPVQPNNEHVPQKSPHLTQQQQQHQARTDPTTGRTTFTFVLFGTASSAAIYFLLRNKRSMNRLQSAKNLAYRDARAWRRVALDFARINALSASRVQKLVAASLRDGQAGSDIGRQIERELEEASRVVAQRRNWILDQDAKDAESSSSSGKKPIADSGWTEVFDLDRTGFFFGSRTGRRDSGLGEYGRWEPRHASRHDDVSSASTDGLAFKAKEAWTRSTPQAAENGADAAVAAAPPAPKRSAQLKWQRAAGLSASAVNDAPASASDSPVKDAAGKKKSSAVDIEQRNNVLEEWIGDVDRAMRQRDLKTSAGAQGIADQAAVEAFARYDTEPSVDYTTGVSISEQEAAAAEEEYHLLPVSDLNIATGGQLRDGPENALKAIRSSRSAIKAKFGPAQVKTTVTSPAQYSYPISDQFRDLEDVFMAAWDDNFAGLSNSAPAEPATPIQAVKDVPKAKAGPNSALFDRLRAQSTKTKPNSKLSNDQITEVMAELMFKGNASGAAASSTKKPDTTSSAANEASELLKRLESKETELSGHKRTVRELSERLDTMREMCHDLTDEAQKRDKTHRIQIEQLEQKVGLFTVWAEEMQRRLGLETPPFFASLRTPIKRD